jgi:hypothetical protein
MKINEILAKKKMCLKIKDDLKILSKIKQNDWKKVLFFLPNFIFDSYFCMGLDI